ASSGIDVSVNINKTGSDVKTLGVDGLSSVRSGNVFSDGSNFVVANGDIADFVNVVFWVEDRSVLDEEVVFFLSEEWRRKKQEEKKTFHDGPKNPLKRFNTGDGKYCRTEEKCHGEMML